MPALRGRGAIVGPRMLERVPHGAQYEAPRMGGEERRDVGLGQQGVHGGEPAARVGHGVLALVVSRGAGFGTGVWATPTPAAATPLKPTAPRPRPTDFAPGGGG